MSRHLLFVVSMTALMGCGGKSSPATLSGECINPTKFGAIVDDGKDDREAIQAAVDAAGREHADVCLPSGTLHVSRNANDISSIVIAVEGVGIRGSGETSRLEMLATEAPASRDWWVIRVSGSRHTLQDFSISGTARGITNEQTHLIQVLGPANDVLLQRLQLSLPEQSTSRGGDCIRLLGEKTAPVHNVRIANVEGIACARSFIAFQRHVSDVIVEKVKSISIGGAAIDMEPTGDGAIRNVVIRTSEFRRGEVARGGWAISLAGNAIPSENLVLEDSMIEASVWVYNVHGATIRRNKIVGGMKDRGMVRITKDSQRIVVDHNVLLRNDSEGDGVEITSHNGAWPSTITIKNNEITLLRGGFPIHAEPVDGIDVVDNRVRCAPNSGAAAIYLRGVATSIRRPKIRNNHIRGNCAQAVRVARHGAKSTGDIVVEDNEVDGASEGVVFENGEPDVPPVVNRNVFRGVPNARRVLGAERKGFRGSNSE